MLLFISAFYIVFQPCVLKHNDFSVNVLLLCRIEMPFKQNERKTTVLWEHVHQKDACCRNNTEYKCHRN